MYLNYVANAREWNTFNAPFGVWVTSSAAGLMHFDAFHQSNADPRTTLQAEISLPLIDQQWYRSVCTTVSVLPWLLGSAR
jgi:hypothetical protein